MKQESRANHAVELVAVTFSAVLLGGASALSQPRIPDTPGFSYFPITTPNSGSFQVTVAWDGNFWFTEQNGNSIGKVTPDGSITEFPIPTPFSFPALITSCPDGSIWFTEAAANQIGRVARDGTITEFPVLTPNS